MEYFVHECILLFCLSYNMIMTSMITETAVVQQWKTTQRNIPQNKTIPESEREIVSHYVTSMVLSLLSPKCQTHNKINNTWIPQSSERTDSLLLWTAVSERRWWLSEAAGRSPPSIIIDRIVLFSCFIMETGQRLCVSFSLSL